MSVEKEFGIVLGETDADHLASFAKAVENRQPEVAERLMVEIDRAEIVDDGDVPETVVRMGSVVTFVQNGGAERTFTLVFPVDGDLEQGRVSVTTPIGTALLGMAPGQTGSWEDRNGREHSLTIKSVTNVKVPQAQPSMA